MDELKRIGLVWLKWAAIAAACFVVAAWLTGCGTVTMRYDSSGKHPDTRQ